MDKTQEKILIELKKSFEIVEKINKQLERKIYE